MLGRHAIFLLSGPRSAKEAAGRKKQIPAKVQSRGINDSTTLVL
jgi:hypothetical protein